MIRHLFYYLSLAFDFKGAEDGGSLYQIVFFLANLTFAANIVFKERLDSGVAPVYRKVSLILVAHFVGLIVVAVAQGVEFDRFIRISLPYFLLIPGFFVGVRTLARFGIKSLLAMLTISSLVSTIFTVFFGLATGDFADNGIRFQILSPMIYILVPILSFKIIVQRRNVGISLAIMAALLVTIVVSATRSWLLAYIGVVIAAFGISGASSIYGVVKGTLKGFFSASLIGWAAFVILVYWIPEFIARFVDRVLIARDLGFDITTATRIAEVDYQLSAWFANFPSFLFGKGLGASYGFSGNSLEQLVELFGVGERDTEWWFAGHNFWVYSFFTQGLIFGWLIPFLILGGAYYSLKQMVFIRRNWVIKNGQHEHAAAVSYLVFVSIIFSTIGSNPLASRMLGQYIGVFLSIVFSGFVARQRIT